jgi:hypothetical protein
MNNYFYLKLKGKEESAALIAALTRFLNYPHTNDKTSMTQVLTFMLPFGMTTAFNDHYQIKK